MHEASKEHRVGIEPTSPRYDGGIFPLDDQCLLFVSVGPVRIELTSFGLRDRCITLSATIPESVVSFESRALSFPAQVSSLRTQVFFSRRGGN